MSRRLLLAVGLATSASLLLELALTRLFSVTTWYHFAFAVISLALLGLGLGSTLVAVLPRLFPPGREAERMHAIATAAGALTLLALAVALAAPLSLDKEPVGLARIAAYAAAAVLPFAATGAFLALALRLGAAAGRTGVVYAADLAGAALGAALFVPAAAAIGAPGAVIAAALLFATAGHLLAPPTRSGAVSLAVIAVALATLVLDRATGIAGPRYRRGPGLEQPIRTYWNAYSYITVSDRQRKEIFGWGLGRKLPPTVPPRQLDIVIDRLAATAMTAFHGDLAPVSYLSYDVTTAGYALLDRPRVFVAGVGGGRDLLAAVVAGARAVTGVEINDRILDLVAREYRDFAGLAARPEVRLVLGEARSVLARDPGRYDLIQASLIDTWAASSSGAFAMTENSLYTVEAWSLFWDRLSPEGVLSVARWFDEWPRLVSLALDVAAARSDADPRRHVALVASSGVVNLLLKKTAFTTAEVERLAAACDRHGFELVYAPVAAARPELQPLIAGVESWQAFVAGHPTSDLRSPTDDRPFFFYHTRPAEWLEPRALLHVPRSAAELRTSHVDPKHVLLALLAVALAAAVSLLVLPPWLAARREPGATPPLRALLALGAVGLAFMFVEVPLLTRLAIVLGHPTLSLTVVLAGLLVAGGLGSFLSARLPPRRAMAVVAALPAVVAGLALALGPLAARLASLDDPRRIAACLAVVCLLGLPMGMALPTALSRGASRSPAAMPLLFGVNGAFSVLGSVLAMILLLNAGVRATILAGAGLYLAAAILLGGLGHAGRADASDTPAP